VNVKRMYLLLVGIPLGPSGGLLDGLGGLFVSLGHDGCGWGMLSIRNSNKVRLWHEVTHKCQR
jgi:hypothetical protein